MSILGSDLGIRTDREGRATKKDIAKILLNSEMAQPAIWFSLRSGESSMYSCGSSVVSLPFVEISVHIVNAHSTCTSRKLQVLFLTLDVGLQKTVRRALLVSASSLQLTKSFLPSPFNPQRLLLRYCHSLRSLFESDHIGRVQEEASRHVH